MQYLEIETPDGTRRVALAKDRLSIGRLPHNDVPLPYAQISRQHAELRRIAGEWWIRDLDSTNGIHVGTRRVWERRLAPGDRIILAPDVALRFVADEAPSAAGSVAGLAMPVRAEPDPANALRGAEGPALSQGALPSGPLISGGGAQDHYRRTMPAQRSPITPVTLHICQTCGQRTAPDVELCHACHQSIARPCDICHASLLPIQDRCPRCQTPNPSAVRRAHRQS